MAERSIRQQRRELDAVMQRIYSMDRRLQLEVLATLQDYLGAEGGRETKHGRQARLRTEALAALGAAAAYLKLPDETAPNTTQFMSVPAEVRDGWNTSRVNRAWGLWADAINAYEGRPVPESAAQRQLRHATSGRRRTSADHLSSLRAWLSTRPRQITMKSYDDWAHEQNDTLDENRLPHVTAQAMSTRLSLPWADLLAVARGESSFENRVAKVLRERRRALDTQELVTIREAALLAETARDNLDSLLDTGRFPAWVAKIGRTRLWLRADVEDFTAGRRFPARQSGELQDQLLSSGEVAARLGHKPDVIRTRLSRNEHHLTPPPDASTGKDHIWYRERFEDWYEHDYAKGPRTPRQAAKLPGRPAKPSGRGSKSAKSSR